MFDKLTTFKISRDNIEVLDGEMVKTASEFILPEGHNYDPDFLYMRVRAVSAGEYWGPNKNADFFPEEELKKSYKTFLQAHTFKNHENKDIAKAIGDVIEATWNDKMKYVELLIRIDRKVAPTIVRGFEKGFMTDVSMGCKIKYSVCSICGNKAKTRKEYCNHIKYERHKIYSDGRRVYEINIGPKFHDISTVLNGADKTAKTLGILIAGDKVAFIGDENNMEKVASTTFNVSLAGEIKDGVPFFKSAGFHRAYQQSENTLLNFDAITEALSKSAYRKESYIDKIAEIKKEIQGKVISLAKGRINKESFEDVEDVTKLLKLFYTDFWDEDKCKEFANRIKDIANKREIPVEKAFHHFLHAAELAGIELSSLEFDRITRYLQEIDDDGVENIIDKFKNIIPFSNIGDIIDKHDKIVSDTPGSIKVVFGLRGTPYPKQAAGLEHSKILGVLAKKIGNIDDSNVPFIDNDMMSILRPEMPNRSFHRAHLLPRIVKIVKINKSPNFDNLKHFILPLLLNSTSKETFPLAAGAYGYAGYQNDRVKFAFSKEYEAGMEKFAKDIFGYNDFRSEMNQFAEFNKKASSGYTHGKAITRGLPITYGYSAMQRARIKNGENVSGFNRYIAENPGNAFILQAMLGPKLLKKIKKAPKDIAQTAKKIVKAANEALDGNYTHLMSKEAEYIDVCEDFSDVDMFKNAEIDKQLIAEYDEQKATAIKYATILYGLGREDVSNNILNKHSLSENDVNKYLKIATDYFTMEIEKKATFASEVGLSTAQDMLFNPAGASALALGPGNVLDGIVFTKLIRKLQKDTKKKPKPQIPKSHDKV